MRNYGKWRLSTYDLRREHARFVAAITVIGFDDEIENLLTAIRSELPTGYGAGLERMLWPAPKPRIEHYV